MLARPSSAFCDLYESSLVPHSTPPVATAGGRKRRAARQLPDGAEAQRGSEARAGRPQKRARQPHAVAEALEVTTDEHRSSIRAEQRLASPASEQGQPLTQATLARSAA